jgi:hypothetical protein
MTETDLIEDRLRRAFRAVAEEPVTPVGRDTEPQWSGGVPTSPRRRPLLVGAVAVVVVIGFALALVYGPRSSGPVGRHPTSPASHSPKEGPAEFNVVFGPGSPTTRPVLEQVMTILIHRFRGLGVRDVSAAVVGNDVDVSGRAPERAIEADMTVVGATEAVSLRPVECGALPHTAVVGAAAPATSSPLPACGSQYETNEVNLAVTPDPRVPVGYTDRTVPPDPAFTSYRSTPPSVADFDSSRTVLLPTAPGTGGHQYARYVLGPTELNDTDITGARVVEDGGHWAVDLTFTPAVSARWAAFVDENFHQMISIDLDGNIFSTPVIEPTQTGVSSLDGEFQLSGAYTAAQARGIASALGSDAMPVALVRLSETVIGPGLVDGGHR